MKTECNQTSFSFHRCGTREIEARFDGGNITSDAGGLLLKEVEDRFGFLERFASCFKDYRDPEKIEHPLTDLLKQRIFGLALGYEDLLDHDALRLDPLLAAMVGKDDPLGSERAGEADRGKPLAGKSTLNRLELTPAGASQESRYKKIAADLGRIQDFFVDAFLLQHDKPPAQIILDIDATDDPIHGQQSGRFFHGYYKSYCYLPLYIFCGDHPLLALLRPSNIDTPAGARKHLQRIVARLRTLWPDVRILLRGDSGFSRDYLMHWCEEQNVDFLFGIGKNKRLLQRLGKSLLQAKEEFEQTGSPARRFKDFHYCTLTSWSRPRRVVGKAEYLPKGANPRFVVTSLTPEEVDAATLYEEVYCQRGDMENRIKEQQLHLFADRTSCQTMRANQLRLAFATVTYILLRALRQFGLANTKAASAQVETIRTMLLKIGALVKVTVRKVWIRLSEAYPWKDLFTQVYQQLTAWRAEAAGFT